MGTTVVVSNTELSAEPGSSATTEMRVRNTGDVVDQFTLQPLGDAARWIRVDPPAVRLFPGADETVTVTVAPPREHSTPPGRAVWAVKATPSEHPDEAAVGEGTIDVGTFTDIAAELQPQAGRGRLAGRYELAIDNRGNTAVPVRLLGSDQEQSLEFDFAEAALNTDPGSATFVKLKIRPEQRLWRGQPKSHPFQVAVEPQVTDANAIDRAPTDADDPADGAAWPPPLAAPVVLNGTLLQEPIIPKWLWKVALALIGLILALILLWQTLLKPRVESAARDVALDEVAEVEEQVEELAPEVEQAVEQAAEAQEAAEEAEEAASGGGGGAGVVLNETSRPDFFRLVVNAAPGSSAAASSETMNASTEWAITDLVLQNPGGASGRITVRVNGEDILVSALETFRDLDFHYVAPYVIGPGQTTEIIVACASVLPPEATCGVGVSYSGFRTTVSEAPAAGG